MARQDITNLYNTSKYIVNATDASTYSTIQDALDAADAAGGNQTVYVTQGSYTEDLTLYTTVNIEGANSQTTTIIGTHTPPATGSFRIEKCTLQSATDVFSSLAAGSATLIVDNCTFAVTNGFAISLLNWTGSVKCFNLQATGTNDGFFKNTAGASLNVSSSTIGVGSGNAMVLSGASVLANVLLQCPSTLQSTGSTSFQKGCVITNTITTSNSHTLSLINAAMSVGANVALNHTSSSAATLSGLFIDSSNAVVLDGTGTINISDVTYGTNKGFDPALTFSYDASMGLTTPFIVGTYGNYVTIQEAINEANAIGSNATIYIQPGGFTEDLTLRSGINLIGVGAPSTIAITGSHTPPTTGSFYAENIKFINAGSLFINANPGSATLKLVNCECDIEGFIFDLSTWTGTLILNYVDSSASTDTGIVANTSGSAPVKANNCIFGPSTTRINVFTAATNLDYCEMDGIIRISDGLLTARECHFKETVQLVASGAANIMNCFLDSGTASALSVNTTGSCTLNNVVINSSNANVISGTSSITFGSVSYLDGTTIQGTVTKQYTDRQELGQLKLSDSLTGFLYATAGLVSTNTIPLGHDVQVKFALKQDYQVITNTMPVGTAPTNTDGEEVLSVTITPLHSSSTFMIVFNMFGSIAADTRLGVVALFRDNATDTITAQIFGTGDDIESVFSSTYIFYDPVASLNETTYSIRVGATVEKVYINGDSSGIRFTDVATTTLAVIEIPTAS